VTGIEFDHERLAAACSDPLVSATDAAEAMVAEGIPFRDAHEHVAAQVRDGTFEAPESPSRRVAPGPADVHAAVAEARTRFDA
jgi:argininosuccinate lyase